MGFLMQLSISCLIQYSSLSTKGISKKEREENIDNKEKKLIHIFSMAGPRDFIESLADLGFEASLRSDSHGNSIKDSLTRKKEIDTWKYVPLPSLLHYPCPYPLLILFLLFSPVTTLNFNAGESSL